MTKGKVIWLLWGCLVLIPTGVYAQGADDPNHAVVLTLDQTYLGTTRGAVPDGLEVSCGYYPSPAQWHQLSLDRDQILGLRVQSSMFRPVVTVFDPCGMNERICRAAAYHRSGVQFNVSLSADQSVLIRVAGVWGMTGAYNITALSEPLPGMTNDEPNDALPLILDQPFYGTTTGATGSALSLCGYQDTRDVWHTFTADVNGVVRVELENSDFDGVLSVMDPCDMNEWACGFVSCNDTIAQVTLPVVAGQTYLVRVAGDNQSDGDYTLIATRVGDEVEAPAHPIPMDQARPVGPTVTLQWNTDPNEVTPGVSSVTRVGLSAITVNTIYGRDDRYDEYEVNQPPLLQAGRAVGMILDPDQLHETSDGRLQLDDSTLQEAYVSYTDRLLCPEERYLNQIAPGLATGFLVAPQILATAGHVVSCLESMGAERLVVFDVVMTDANQVDLTVEPDNLYYLDQVIAYNDGIPDWALVRLDRPVTGRTPLLLRRSGRLSETASLLVIGHPLGLPRKYGLNGVVRGNAAAGFFESDLDVNGGNSGSPVLDADTLAVEGILFAGNIDFVPTQGDSGRCYQSLVCPDEQDLCQGWEWSTRSTQFADLVTDYDVYLGQDPNSLTLIAQHILSSSLEVTSLAPATQYVWRVVAHAPQGPIPGPLWTFTTAALSSR